MKDVTRVCRKNGSIGIPKDLREMLGLVPGQPVTVQVDANTRSFIIKPQTVSCVICNRTIKHYEGLYGLCPECEAVLARYIKKGMSLSQAYKALKSSAEGVFTVK